MAVEACENCGSRVGVAPVTYTDAGSRVTQELCADCKDALLGRRRARRAPAHRKRGRLPLAQLPEVLREGGGLAYVGVGLFVLGLVLVPLLILLSFLTR